jgi:Ca2+-binding EF-hand superfamily protein
MIRTSFLLAAIVTLTPMVVLAADPAPRPAPNGESEWFKQLDTNQDGVISKDEAAKMPRIAQSFDRLDADHDGMITQDEMRAAAEARREEAKAEMAARFKAADKNGDGLLSKEEATAGMPMVARRFDQLDTNKDGEVSPEELAAARHHFSDGHRPWKGKPGDSTQR